MKIFIVLGLFVIGTAGAALAVNPSPEIDPASGSSALALLAGALVMYQGRRKR